MVEENWDSELAYLLQSRFLCHNDDYLEFLVKKVWRLDYPVKIVDFGCGFGYIGTKLMPLLPAGSRYTGIDKAPTLLKAAKDICKNLGFPHEFIESEVYRTPFADGSFDIAISHVVLMHLERPAAALQEMIRVTRDGGRVITCDANRNAWHALFYVDEFNTQETTPLGMHQQINRDIREKTGVDYNIGIKTPAMMAKAGLQNIGCRVSDNVICLFPSLPAATKKKIFQALCNEGLAMPEDIAANQEKIRARMLAHGVRPEDAAVQLQNQLAMDFRHQGLNYHTVYPELLAWSYGTVSKG